MNIKKSVLRITSKILLPVYLLSSVSLMTTVHGMNSERKSPKNDSPCSSPLPQLDLRDFLNGDDAKDQALIDLLNDPFINFVKCFENGDLEGFKNELLSYYNSNGNLYDFKKRKLFKAMENYLKASDDENKSSVFYDVIKDVNEQLNRIIINVALTDNIEGLNEDERKVLELKRNVLKRILALIQLSKGTYTYACGKNDVSGLNKNSIKSASPGIEPVKSPILEDDGFEHPDYANANEYATSVLAHGETVIFELPYSTTQGDFFKLIGADYFGEDIKKEMDVVLHIQLKLMRRAVGR